MNGDKMKAYIIDFQTIETPDVSEVEALVQDLGYEIAHIGTFKSRDRKFLGRGQLEKIREEVYADETIDTIVFNGMLSGLKYKLLEKFFNRAILSRIDVIIRIFEKRALTTEGRLQVRLAALLHKKSKLVRAWTHLERQRGSTRSIGGPGESQLELDKRMIFDDIEKVKRQLKKVQQDRDVRKATRTEKVVSIIGYSNAGKTTLFNALTDSDLSTSSKPFETLDPFMRQATLPNNQTVIISDTVGFVTHLPPFLVKAFQSTLEQITDADLLLYVTDSSNPDDHEEVMKWLKRLKVENKPLIHVWNKVDLIDKEKAKDLDGVKVSAQTGEGIDKLFAEISAVVSDVMLLRVKLDYSQTDTLSWLMRNRITIKTDNFDDHVLVECQLSTVDYKRFKHLFPGVLVIE